jgi:hypothetical protein
MKLAEALAERAAARQRLEQLRGRIASCARYQEGDEPPEDAGALLVEADATLDQLEALIRRVNRTNARAHLPAGGTLTDALARRDALRFRHSLLSSAADAASGAAHHGVPRQLRSELRMIAALPVADLRTRADSVSRELRDLDVQIQRANWEVDLVD